MAEQLNDVDAAVGRLLRAVAITQVSLSTRPQVSTFRQFNMPPMIKALSALQAALDAADPHQIVTAPTQVIGSSTADLLAEAVAPPTPDTLPPDWSPDAR